jgi:sodium-dependent dicarboxylate transporter 2/3/5
MSDAIQKTAGTPPESNIAPENKKPKDGAYYVKTVIGLAIMIFFGWLPAPAPITQVGMVVLGQFIGLIFLWTLVDMVWPTFAAVILFGFVATDIYPGSFALAGVYEAGLQSFGNWCVVIVIGLLLLCEVYAETGVIKRIALWFLTRKTAMKSPWGFTFMFLLAALVIGLLLDVSCALIFMLALAKEIFTRLGLNEDDKWTRVITIGITFTVIMGFAATPICHTLPILFMGIYAAIAGVGVNWVSYMLIAVPIFIVIWLIMLAFFRYIVKPDMSKLEKADFSKIRKLREDLGPIGKRELAVIAVSIFLIVFWLLPGILSITAPSASFTIWLDSITMLTPLFVAIVIMAVVRIEGRPLLDISEAMRNVSFHMIFLLAGIMMIASAMGESTTGISDWLAGFLAPIVSGMSPFALVAFLAAVSILVTNFANNVPVGIVMITIGVPLALQMNINPFIVAVTVSFASNLGYAIPPAFVPVGICYSDPFGGAKYTFRWGIATMCISIVVSMLLLYPLGVLFG